MISNQAESCGGRGQFRGGFPENRAESCPPACAGRAASVASRQRERGPAMLLVKPGYSPTKLLVAASICCASLVSVPTPAFAACQAGQAGCVLPVGAAPLSTVQTTTP